MGVSTSCFERFIELLLRAGRDGKHTVLRGTGRYLFGFWTGRETEHQFIHDRTGRKIIAVLDGTDISETKTEDGTGRDGTNIFVHDATGPDGTNIICRRDACGDNPLFSRQDGMLYTWHTGEVF